MSKSSRQRQRKNGCELPAVKEEIASRLVVEFISLPGIGVPRRITDRTGTTYDNSFTGGFVNVTKLAEKQNATAIPPSD